jgi:hypothetical protein
MPKAALPPSKFLLQHLESLVTSEEVLRLINDISACQLKWDVQPSPAELEAVRGLELFPCLTAHFGRKLLEVKGLLYPNLNLEGDGVSHLIRLDMGEHPVYLRLRSSYSSFLLSPFHSRFLSSLFGRILYYHLSCSPAGRESMQSFTPYSLEEQVVASYLQSLEWSPCATIKLDAQDNPYIGSMLHSAADLRRCEMPGSSREEAIIRAWRLFKRMLYFSIEGERLSTGFAFLTPDKPLDYYCQMWPTLMLFDEADHAPLDSGMESIKQFLINADGRTTFLAVYRAKIIGLLHLTRGTHRQLTTLKSWRAALALATISPRGRVTFWLALRGRKNPRIPLSVLEYRQGHLHIPLFQDIFWQELERHLKTLCPEGNYPTATWRLKNLLGMLRRSGRGGIFILGLTEAQLTEPDTPIENQVHLAQPLPLQERWLPHLLGLAKSDGAVIFNDRLEACQSQARLKATALHLPPEQDDLGRGIRHQVTREFSAYAPNTLGICISQDGHISLYRQGKLISRLY